MAVVAGSALASGGVVVTVEELRMREVQEAGHAVGDERPDDLRSATVIYRATVKEPVMALTFDDGPAHPGTRAVLDVLDARGVPGTFFVLGRQARAEPSLLRETAERHEIGNHSWDHPDLSTASAATARDQLIRTHDVIGSITGQAPHLFRPPYGRFSGATVMQATGLGYSIVLWSHRLAARGETARHNVSRLGPSCGPGAIVLAHDGSRLPTSVTTGALPGLLDAWLDRGLQLVTVSELVRLAAAAAPTPNSTKHATHR